MRNLRKVACSRRAFTVIELLVVIAIIGLLAALLFPAYAAARRKGQQSQCVSNLHQISRAFSLYRSDWEGAWPPGPAFSGDYHHGWWLPLQTYIKGKQDMLSCPAVVRSSANIDSSHIPGYALNSRLQVALRSVSEGDVSFPAMTVELCDAPEKFTFISGYDPWKNNIKRPDPIPDVSWERHSGGANYLFCDGHVQWYPPGVVADDGDYVQNGTRPTFALKWKY